MPPMADRRRQIAGSESSWFAAQRAGKSGDANPTCASPAHQIHLDTNQDAPLAWTLEAGGFLLHLLKDGVLTTHVVNGPAPTATVYA